MISNKALPFIFVVMLVLISSCSDNSTGSDPNEENNNNNEQTAEKGTLEVTTTTSGSASDDNGYTVSLDGNNYKSIDVNGSVIYDDLDEGTYSVELSDISSDCAVDEDNPVSAEIIADETTTVDFSLTCQTSAPQVNGIIVFAKGSDPASSELYKMNADGSDKQKIGNGITGTQPALSPDGSEIAYTVFEENKTSIWKVDINGENPQQLTTPADYFGDSYPAWSSDGSKIAYQSYAEKNQVNSDIYIMDANGNNPNNPTQLTNDPADEERPSWSPVDANTIIFTGDRNGDGDSEIHSIAVDTKTVSTILDPTEDEGINIGDAAWSPDGTQIAYQGYTKLGSSSIFIVDADGSNASYITSTDFGAWQPTWSPDGDHLAFMNLADATEGTTDAIWIISKDGSESYKLTDDQNTYSKFPNWGN